MGAAKSTYKIDLSLRLSRNLKILKWGTFLGGVAGVVLSEIYFVPILAVVGLSATSAVATFCLPLVMIALSALAVSAFLWGLFGDSRKHSNTKHTYQGMTLSLNKIASSNSSANASGLTMSKAQNLSYRKPEFEGKESNKSAAIFDFKAKLSIARFARGAIPMGVLGAAGALTAGWFFSGPVMAFFGLTGIAAAAVAYPVILLVVGALAGVLLGGAIGVGVGKLRAWHKGSDKINPTYRRCFSHIRLMQLRDGASSSEIANADTQHASYKFMKTKGSKLSVEYDSQSKNQRMDNK